MKETKPCPNPRCVDGFDFGYTPAAPDSPVPPTARCCHTCEGRGVIAVEPHLNRRHYYRIQSVADAFTRDAVHKARQFERASQDDDILTQLPRAAR